MPRWRPPNYAGVFEGDILIKLDGTVWIGERKMGYVGDLHMTAIHEHITGRWQRTELQLKVEVMPEPAGPDAVYSFSGELIGWLEDGEIVRYEHESTDAGTGQKVRLSPADQRRGPREVRKGPHAT